MDKNFIDSMIGRLKEVLTIKHSPLAIASGFALGTFIAILPTPGVNLLIAISMVFIFSKINKIALFSALIFWNYFITIPLNILGLKLGSKIFSDYPKYTHIFFGSIMIGIFLSIISFGVIYFLILFNQRERN